MWWPTSIILVYRYYFQQYFHPSKVERESLKGLTTEYISYDILNSPTTRITIIMTNVKKKSKRNFESIKDSNYYLKKGVTISWEVKVWRFKAFGNSFLQKDKALISYKKITHLWKYCLNDRIYSMAWASQWIFLLNSK